MLNMKYIGDETTYPIEFNTVSNNVVELKGDFPVLRVGFILSRPKHKDNWNYEDFTTVYREIRGGVQFSNDGSVYVAPDPIPGPIVPEYKPYEPTLEEIKVQKIREMNAEQQKIIQNGVEVQLSDGTVERFSLKDQDQISLSTLQKKAETGDDKIPWHVNNKDEHCRYFSADDMLIITETALKYVTYHVTYFRDLRIYINSMQDKESVQSVAYGMYIPAECQSEVLADFYSAKNA